MSKSKQTLTAKALVNLFTDWPKTDRRSRELIRADHLGHAAEPLGRFLMPAIAASNKVPKRAARFIRVVASVTIDNDDRLQHLAHEGLSQRIRDRAE